MNSNLNTFSRRHALGIVFGATLTDAIGFGIVLPVLPRLLHELTGETMSDVASDSGWLLLVFAVAQFLFSPVMGNLSDRFGRRPVLLTSMMAFGFDYLLMAVAPTFAWLFLGRAIAGLAGAVYAPASACIADVTPPEKRAQSFALMGAAFGIGFIAGPAIGGLLGGLGTRAPFFVAAGLALANAAIGFVLLPETLSQDLRRPFNWRKANPFSALRQLTGHQGLGVILAAWFLWLLAHQIYPSTWAVFAKLKFDWSEAEIGASLAYVGVMMAMLQVIGTGRIVKRIGEAPAALIGMSAAGIGFVVNALAQASWIIYVSMTFGALQGLVFPSMNAILSKRVAADRQGELQGGLASMQSVAAILGYLILPQTLAFFTGPAAPIVFPGAAFILAALLTAGAGALLLAAIRGRAGQAQSAPPVPEFRE